VPPANTALGSLLSHLRRPNTGFQPSNVVFSMFPPQEALARGRSGKRERHLALAERALTELEPWLAQIGRPPGPAIQPLLAAELAPRPERETTRPLMAAANHEHHAPVISEPARSDA
jgi:hypothetical protein